MSLVLDRLSLFRKNFWVKVVYSNSCEFEFWEIGIRNINYVVNINGVIVEIVRGNKMD